LQINSIDDITTNHRRIFLSPHFDDAVYSCGGTLGVQVNGGFHPLVITIFGGVSWEKTLSPLALKVHSRMGFSQDIAATIQARRHEDAEAMEHLGVDYLWLDYPDAIYRGTPAHYTPNNLIGGEVHPGDYRVNEELITILGALCKRLPNAVWYAPLGVGRHVDHQIVCSVANCLIQLGARVNFYEDFPYVVYQRGLCLVKRLGEFGCKLECEVVEMSRTLHLRQEASAKYASQTVLNFGDEPTLFRAMADYTHCIRPDETMHHERYWIAHEQRSPYFS